MCLYDAAYRRALDLLERALGVRNIRAFDAVLEIGAGTGTGVAALLDAFPVCKLTVTDISAERVAAAAARHSHRSSDGRVLRYAVANMHALPPAQLYDLVVAQGVLLSYTRTSATQLHSALCSIASVVSPGGALLVADRISPPDRAAALVAAANAAGFDLLAFEDMTADVAAAIRLTLASEAAPRPQGDYLVTVLRGLDAGSETRAAFVFQRRCEGDETTPYKSNPAGHETDSASAYNVGTRALLAGDANAAYAALLLAFDPAVPLADVAHNLAVAARLSGRRVEAVRWARLASDLAPQSAVVAAHLGTTLAIAGGGDGAAVALAATEWRRAVRLRPDCLPALYSLAMSASDPVERARLLEAALPSARGLVFEKLQG